MLRPEPVAKTSSAVLVGEASPLGVADMSFEASRDGQAVQMLRLGSLLRCCRCTREASLDISRRAGRRLAANVKQVLD